MSRPDAAVGRGFLKLGAGEAVARLISFAVTVYLARRLGADVYGMIVLATTIMAYVAPVADCGVELLGVHEVARDRQQLPALLRSFLGARLFVAGILTLLIAAVGLTVFPQPEGAILAAYAFTLAPIALGTRWVHLGLEQTGRVSLSRAGAEALIALVIVILVHTPGGVGNVPLAQILGEAFAAFLLMLALPMTATTLRAVVRLEVVASLYRRSWPLVLNGLLGLVIFNSDYFFLRVYQGSAAVGYYAAAYALVSFFLNVGNSYQMTLLPAVTRAMGNREQERALYHSAQAQVFAGVLPVAVGGCLVAPRLVSFVFGAEYGPSVLPLQILLWALPIALFRNIAQGVMIAHGRQDQMLHTSLAGAASNLILNLVLIPPLGMAGAALVTVTTESVRTLPMLRLLGKASLPMAPPARFWRTLLAAAVMTIVLVTLHLTSVWLTIASGALAYVVTLVAVGGLRLRRGALPELRV